MKRPTPPRLDWMDAARGLAALWVVLFHVRVDLWVGWNAIQANPGAYSGLDRALAWLSIPCAFGGSGVMLFFLISGFCVHLPQAAKPGRLHVASYGARRFFRIYPPYLAAVLLTLACEIGARHVGPDDATSVRTWWQTALMIQNYGDVQPRPNAALWSLPVEMELYVAYIFLFWLVQRCGWRVSLIVAAVGSAAMNVGLWAVGYGWFHGNFLQFWLIWSAGAWLAEWWAAEKVPAFNGWWGMLGLMLAGAGLSARTLGLPFIVQDYVWAGFYFLALWWALARPGWFERVPAPLRRALTVLGVCSYSVYLVHFPVFYLGGAIWRNYFGGKPASFLVPLAATALVLPLGWLFWRITEDPSQRFARNLARRLQGKAKEGA